MAGVGMGIAFIYPEFMKKASFDDSWGAYQEH
jgi:hypothetical protein